jgi:uncharacterized protein
MWNFLVENIPQEGLELKKQESPRFFNLEDDRFVSYTGAVAVSLTMEKLGERVRIKGEFNFRVKLNCVRCLEPFFQEITYPMDIVYAPEPSRMTGKEASLNEEEINVFYYGKKGVIELGDAVREFVLLSLPVKPLCKPDCSGLCPSCGKKLSQGSCSCQIQRLDARFAKLKDLKERKK